MFIGRESELSTLNNLYKSEKFEFVVLYGRRRIGKSALIQEFIKDKPNIYFTAVDNDLKINLEYLSRAIFKFIDPKKIKSTFNSIQDALETVFELSCEEHFVFVIDEFPYIAQVAPYFSSLLQMLIDKYQNRSKLFLILCGSSISYIEKEVLAYKAPLFGRRTAQIKLSALPFKEVIRFYPELNNEDQLLLYGIYGGTPHYLNQYSSKLNLEENLRNNFLNPNAPLFTEPDSLIKQEVKETNRYNSILTAVANGNTKLSEIANQVNDKLPQTSYILNNLIELDLIEKEEPYLSKKNNRGIYRIKDQMFRFWYRFISQNSDTIYLDLPDITYQNISPYLNEFLGYTFELICREYLIEKLKNNKLPVQFRSIGRWWGSNPKTKEQEEIDIMAEQDNQTALFAECKWTNKKVDVNVLNNLIRKAQIFDYPVKYYFLFSKSGFTDTAIKKAEEIPNIYLITYDEIFDFLKNS